MNPHAIDGDAFTVPTSDGPPVTVATPPGEDWVLITQGAEILVLTRAETQHLARTLTAAVVDPEIRQMIAAADQEPR